MQRITFLAAAAAFLVLPAVALAAPPLTDLSSQSVGVEVGPGGVRVGPTHNRWRSERATVRRGPDCRELRAACLNKERLGEQGEGNCRRYRRLCR
jgi:hypothetical protein